MAGKQEQSLLEQQIAIAQSKLDEEQGAHNVKERLQIVFNHITRFVNGAHEHQRNVTLGGGYLFASSQKTIDIPESHMRMQILLGHDSTEMAAIAYQFLKQDGTALEGMFRYRFNPTQIWEISAAGEQEVYIGKPRSFEFAELFEAVTQRATSSILPYEKVTLGK